MGLESQRKRGRASGLEGALETRVSIVRSPHLPWYTLCQVFAHACILTIYLLYLKVELGWWVCLKGEVQASFTVTDPLTQISF